jgi:hypothetical protein
VEQFIQSIESPFAVKLLLGNNQGFFLLNYPDDIIDRLENYLDGIKHSIKYILKAKEIVSQ